MEGETRMLNEYGEFTDKTAIYPHALTGNMKELMYLSLGLCGEAGETANRVKQLIHDGINQKGVELTLEECGAIFWYLCRLVKALGSTPEEVINQNMKKLIKMGRIDV